MNPEHVTSSYRGKTVCVTGGAGFIGSHLTDALVDAGADVRVIDDLSHGREENLQRHTAGDEPAIRFIRGSILDPVAMQEAVGGAEIIFHEAALGSVPHSVEAPELYNEVNAVGTLRLLESARSEGVRRIVYAASSSVYGDGPELPKIETMRPDPRSPYATAKLEGEHWLATYAHCYGVSTISLRYFNIFGPRQRPDSQYAAVIPAFASAMLNGDKPRIYGDGEQTRDFTHVKNVVWANLLAGAAENDLRGEVVNIACGQSYTINELLQNMAEILELPADRESLPERTGEVKHSLADINAARVVIGYEPIIEFRAGLAETMQAFRVSLRPV